VKATFPLKFAFTRQQQSSARKRKPQFVAYKQKGREHFLFPEHLKVNLPSGF
jgi:hypothetical protein